MEKIGNWKISASLETINGLLTKLRMDVAKVNASFEILKGICFDLISALAVPIYKYNGFVLRARPNESKLYSKQSQISYNSETPSLIAAQRFNLNEEQVFYCAIPVDGPNQNGMVTTIAECFKDIFDKKSSWQKQAFTIGRWLVQKPINLLLLAFYNEAVKNSSHLHDMVVTYQRGLNELYNEEDQNKVSNFL